MSLIAAGVQAADVDVAITNLTHGSYFTPLLAVSHANDIHLYTLGTKASSALKSMAECGMLGGLVSDLDGNAMVTLNDHPLEPGATAMKPLNVMPTANYISVVGMVLPTNDGFVGVDGIAVPSKPGTYTYFLNAYDAGTEANSETLDTEMGCVDMPGIPVAPGMDGGKLGTGVTETEKNETVHVHRGVLGDTNPDGGASDLDSTIHRWQNPVAKLTLTVK